MLPNVLVLSCLKQFFVFIFLIACFTRTSAQERPVEGIVFDADSKHRLSRVYIYNLRTHKGFYNNIRGEFKTTAASGDTLVAATEGYRVDTVTIRSQGVVLFHLRRNSIQLREVVITDTLLSPEERLRLSKREYKDAYRKADPQDLFQLNTGNRLGGAGLGIDALYSLLSREGKNARNLQKIIERDYRESIIDYRFTAGLVGRVTGLSGDTLRDFMQQYRPSYYFILEANDYELISFIKENLKQYKKDPSANRVRLIIPENK